jgi:EAL domain-containing protein (putative c-di-GMP-specific phosphodiesterase class I)
VSNEFFHRDAQIVDADPGLSGLADPLATLRSALDEDDLQLFCQPIRSLSVGGEPYPLAEVLVRLREEEEALLPPGDFLPVFEHYRMLCELDCWVVKKTIAWMAEARPDSFRAYSVNVSSQSLGDPRLLNCIASELALHAVDPQRLCLEIDEEDTLLRAESAAQFSGAVRDIGCRLLIDGFARRSVSFTALKALQPDFVKIDGAVVRKISSSTIALLKLKAIIRVGAVTGIGTIAECVEAQSVIEQLTGLSVGFAQGFGVARPQPIASGSFPPS